ncbi:MAG TPA: PilZ domain-containing protein [Desulfopila sp.]|nr:PilZ domain-containing protein [Desulfopila sp.]
MESQDRRLEERHSLQINVRLSADEDSAGNPVREELTITNISSGGAFLTTPTKIPLASKVNLGFLVNYDQLKTLRFILSVDSLKKFADRKIWVKATGIVIRIEEEGFAIIFDEYYQLTPMDTEPG